MPPSLALALGWICAIVLLRFDSSRANRGISAGLWIPTIWLLIVGSRPVSVWFAFQDTNRARGIGLNPAEVYAEGSPLDRNIFLLLIIAGVYILIRRRIKLLEFVRQNPWLVAFVVYAGFSCLWSDFMGVSFKRWIKLLGNVVMAAIVATELDGTEAFRRVLARCAYILMPLSIVLIKYFGEYGRKFNPHTGYMTLTGVTSQKNELGMLCMVAALFIVWSWTMKRTIGTASEERLRLIGHAVCAGMVVWLLIQADSATSYVTTVLGVMLLMLFHARRGSTLRFVTPAILGSLVFLVACHFSGLLETVILAMGEDLTLTGRTELWAEVLAARTNPLIGSGFESFWMSTVAADLWQKYWWRPNQAHNGFLETYLNLGMIGVVWLCGFLVHVYSSSLARMRSSSFELGRFGFTFIAIALLHNITEAGFHGLSLVWVMQIMCGVKYAAPASPVPSVTGVLGSCRSIVRPSAVPIGRAKSPIQRFASHGMRVR